MSLEYILYNIGAGLPIVLALAAVAGIGWLMRKEVGLMVGAGIAAAILSFGAVVRQAGDALTQQQAGIAAGAAAISTAAAFLAVHVVNKETRTGLGGYGTLVAALGTLTMVVLGALCSMIVTLLLTKNPWQTSYTESLIVYAFLFGGGAYALAALRGGKSDDMGGASMGSGDGSDTTTG